MQNAHIIAVGFCLATALAGVALGQAPASSQPANSEAVPAVAACRRELMECHE
jgi:hypothetical protein